jgi:hypothetical protein
MQGLEYLAIIQGGDDFQGESEVGTCYELEIQNYGDLPKA